jgi:L-lysine 6-transaminase
MRELQRLLLHELGGHDGREANTHRDGALDGKGRNLRRTRSLQEVTHERRTRFRASSRARDSLARHMLADGFDIVLDLEKSRGRRLWDARQGDRTSTFSRSSQRCRSGSTTRSWQMTRFPARSFSGRRWPTRATPTSTPPSSPNFVETFSRVGIPSYLPHAFFVAGGALGVENALKAAMDWKVRLNFRKGYREEKGHQVMHFRQAFHGRSGYTLSMTNTADPRKYQYFAMFDWPRIVNPRSASP